MNRPLGMSVEQAVIVLENLKGQITAPNYGAREDAVEGSVPVSIELGNPDGSMMATVNLEAKAGGKYTLTIKEYETGTTEVVDLHPMMIGPLLMEAHNLLKIFGNAAFLSRLLLEREQGTDGIGPTEAKETP